MTVWLRFFHLYGGFLQIYTVLCKVIMRSCNNKHKKKLLIFGCFMQQMLILTHILYVVMKLKMSEIVINVFENVDIMFEV